VSLLPAPSRAAEEGTFSGTETFTCTGVGPDDTQTIDDIFGAPTMALETTWTIKVPPIVSADAAFPVLAELHPELPEELIIGTKKLIGADEVTLDAGVGSLLGKSDVAGGAAIAFDGTTASTDDLPITFSASEIVEDAFHAVSNAEISEGTGHVVLDDYTMSMVFSGPNDTIDLDVRCLPDGDVKADVNVIHQEDDGVADPPDPVVKDPTFTG
jgi:hypothetical protein